MSTRVLSAKAPAHYMHGRINRPALIAPRHVLYGVVLALVVTISASRWGQSAVENSVYFLRHIVG